MIDGAPWWRQLPGWLRVLLVVILGSFLTCACGLALVIVGLSGGVLAALTGDAPPPRPTITTTAQPAAVASPAPSAIPTPPIPTEVPTEVPAPTTAGIAGAAAAGAGAGAAAGAPAEASSTPAPTAESGAPGAQVSRAEFGDDWPLTVEEGVLACLPGSRIVLFAEGNVYAVNGLARGNMEANGWRDIEEIWADAPGDLGLKKDIGPLIQRGQALCS